MEIEVKVKFDTEKQDDLDLIEDLYDQLQDIKELLEIKKQNLNKSVNRKQKVRQ